MELMAGAQPPHEYGIRYLHTHMSRAGQFVRFRDRHVREIRHRDRLIMARDEAQPHLRKQEQPHDQQGRQEQIPDDPVAQKPLGLGLYLFLAIVLCHGNIAFYLSTYKVINNSPILRNAADVKPEDRRMSGPGPAFYLAKRNWGISLVECCPRPYLSKDNRDALYGVLV